ncbi:MAG: IS110 family transposase [Chloroflexota bacterium]|nr:IS110 family transposase [Chloroflexota bacterium]
MTQENVYIGIDVSKKSLDAAIHEKNTYWDVANDAKGIQALVKRLKSLSPALIVLESTGGLERNAATALYLEGLPVAIVNPRRTREFAKALGVLAKTDELDAGVIAHYAKAVNPPLSRMSTEKEQQLTALVRRRMQLVAIRTAEINRLKSAGKGLHDHIRKHINWLNKEIDDLEERTAQLVQNCPLFQEKDAVIQSFKGVGAVTSHILLSEVPELGQLNRKEVAALMGLAPMNNDSGGSQGKRSIQGGRARPRNALYMAAIASLRCNPVIREFYHRLLENGKPTKVAITACMRKMLVIINSMVRNMKPWDPNFAPA